MTLTMELENRHLLVEGAEAFGIRLNEKQVAAFDLYLGELLKWNQKINLTAIRSEKGIILKHFLDSLSVYPLSFQNGFPSGYWIRRGIPGNPVKNRLPLLRNNSDRFSPQKNRLPKTYHPDARLEGHGGDPWPNPG